MLREKKEKIILIAELVTVLLALFICWASLTPPALDSVRHLTVIVHHSDGSEAAFSVDTTERVLLEALRSCDFVELGPTDYGYRVIVADGEAADAGAGVFWVFAVNDEIPEDRADTQAVTDGDVFDYYIRSYAQENIESSERKRFA